MLSTAQRIGKMITKFNTTPCCKILDNNFFKDATRESINTNTRHAVGDSDGGQTIATKERIISNARHAVGDSDGCQTTTFKERLFTNTRHAICNIIIIERSRNYNIVRIFVRVSCHFSNLIICIQIVIDAVNLYSISTCDQW